MATSTAAVFVVYRQSDRQMEDQLKEGRDDISSSLHSIDGTLHMQVFPCFQNICSRLVCVFARHHSVNRWIMNSVNLNCSCIKIVAKYEVLIVKILHEGARE